jgi:predicted double-glycine peptidase
VTRVLFITVALALSSGTAAAQHGARFAPPPAGARPVPVDRGAPVRGDRGASVRSGRSAPAARNAPARPGSRPTIGQRIKGAVRGAIVGFRLGTFRAPGARRQVAAGQRIRRLNLPNVRQANGYTCGAAALQAVLRYFGKGGDLGEEELAARLGTTSENGTSPAAILRVAREHGLIATMREHMTIADLEDYVARGVPVIVDYQAWAEQPNHDYTNDWENGHYSVVVGVDRRNVYLEDPSILGARGRIPRAEFEARWHDQETPSERYHRMGIALESPDPHRFEVRVSRTVRTE